MLSQSKLDKREGETSRYETYMFNNIDNMFYMEKMEKWKSQERDQLVSETWAKGEDRSHKGNISDIDIYVRIFYRGKFG